MSVFLSVIVTISLVDLKFILFAHIFNAHFTDRRVSFCFSKIEEGQCSMSNALDVSKSTCCCSMGAGWGDPCELCPDPKTEEGAIEYKYLCPQGPGYLNNNFTGKSCQAVINLLHSNKSNINC